MAVRPEERISLSVPYASGDKDGRLTSQLIEQIEKEGLFRYSPEGSKYVLKVRILDTKYENIGFRYDPKRLAKEQKEKLIPNETRSRLLAEVTIVNNETGKNVLGPAHILSTSEYDHQNYSINNDINRFSLGQLSDIDTAQDVMNIPLYRNLAKEINFYLANHFQELFELEQ
jgi:hypothetical protein